LEQEHLLKNIGEYEIRKYEEGDETELASLFNNVYHDYAGFVPRTPEYWRWSCLDRPDVEKEGIMVVVNRGKIVAYAVVGKSGNIWESCFDDAHDEKALLSLVLERAIKYLTRVGSDLIILNLPSEDSVARETCEKLGLSELPPDVMFLSVLDFKQLLELLCSAKKDKLSGFDGDFLVRFKDAPSWISPFVMIKFKNGQTEIKNENKSCEVLIETDTATFTSIMFGVRRPLWALARFKLKIHPPWKLRRVLRLLSFMCLDDPWFFPRSDLG
jgi:hypothetical protein